MHAAHRLHGIKIALWSGLSLCIGACQHAPHAPARNSSVVIQQPTPSVTFMPVVSLPTPADLPPLKPSSTVKYSFSQQQTPDSYRDWIGQYGATRAQRYQQFLQQNGVQHVPPLAQLLVSARDWQSCNREQYDIPPQTLWGEMIPTLKVLDELINQRILWDFEISSSYRDAELNACAKGSMGSKHVQNAAIDLRLLGEQALPEQQSRIRQQLCDFWTSQGAQYQLGLGLYANGQIHLDSKGYRTWGPDYTRNTSVCAGR